MPDSALSIPSDSADILREKLRTMFVELMPDEKLDEVLQAEWSAFMNDKTEKTTSWGFDIAWSSDQTYSRKPLNNDSHAISPIKNLIRTMILEMFTEAIKGRLQYELNELHMESVNGPGAVTSQIVKESADEILQAALRGVVGQAGQFIQQALRNGNMFP